MAGKSKGFQILSNTLLIILSLSAILPLWLLVVSSVTSDATLNKEGFSFLIRGLDFSAYSYIFRSINVLMRAYGMTFLVAFTGTCINLALTIGVAYALSKKDLIGRNLLSFFVFFTMLFNGGMVPSYIIWSQLFHVVDTVWGLILPNLLMSAFNVILMRTYFTTTIPSEITEAAEVDSCSQAGILFRIVLPLSKPMIATVTLFSVLGYWNDWINGLYYIVMRKELYTIQNILNSLQNSGDFIKQYINSAGLGTFMKDIPTLSFKLALAVMSVLPILTLYAIFQKAFVRGIIIGGVKG